MYLSEDAKKWGGVHECHNHKRICTIICGAFLMRCLASMIYLPKEDHEFIFIQNKNSFFLSRKI